MAAQGLLCLSDDQPKEGYICNLHADSKKDKNSDDNKDQVKDDLTKEKSNDSTDEIENSDLTNQEEDNLKKDDSMEKKTITEKGNEDIRKNVANVQKPIHLKRQQYVKGKLSLKTHPFVKSKRNKVVK